jgi:Domain of unknown function (DUF1844)
MSDTPKFTVVDRRKFRGEDAPEPEAVSTPSIPEAETKPAPAAAPRLTLVEPPAAKAESESSSVAVAEEPEIPVGAGPTLVTPDADDLEAEDAESQSAGFFDDSQLPPAPTDEESRFQKLAYDQAAERLDVLVRSQNPALPAPEKIGFEHLVQQLYLSAMMQMGAGTPEGQRPRIDILGARQTIDLLGVVKVKSAGNLNAEEIRAIDTVLFELHSTFLELTRMISAQSAAPMPPPPGGFGPAR